MGNLFFISIRRLRAPLIFIIAVFSVSTVGLALIPGVGPDGTPWRPTLFEAFYFVTYTATTIGFGELPYSFDNVQRLWVTATIYLSVVGWAYLLGTMLALVGDRGFRAALVAARFGRAVRSLREPFYLLAGLGETGLTVARGLDALGEPFVALDRDEAPVLALDLGDFVTDPPAMAGDVTSPEVLALAGLGRHECRGVLALTPDDRANLAIAVAARLLHPGLRVIARAHEPGIMRAMETAGVTEVINPYRAFAERLAVAVRAPDTHRLLTWLTGPPGSNLPARLPAPPGRWVVCGYGRFGAEVVRAIEGEGFSVTIVDPDEPEDGRRLVVQGLGFDAECLEAAGIATADGVVAGSDDDTANLAMAMAARKANPRIFVIVRQNHVHNRPLFRALGAAMVMEPSQIIADECLSFLRARHLSAFLDQVYARDNDWAARVTTRLQPVVGDLSPTFWSVRLDQREAPGFLDAMARTRGVRLGDLCRDILDRDRPLPCVALRLAGRGRVVELPGPDEPLNVGDDLLFAGQERARRDMAETMQNANTATFVLTGREPWTLLGRLLAGRVRA